MQKEIIKNKGSRFTVHGSRFTVHRSLFTILIAILFFSCKSSKEIRIALPEKSKSERLDLIIGQELSYRTFFSNANFTIQTGEKKNRTSVDGQLKMIKDQAVQISLKMPLLGTELFRVTFTPEKVIIIDRLNKQYLAESMQAIQAEMPFDFDFYSFQALLSNRLFIAGKSQIQVEDYLSFRIEEDAYRAQITNTDTHNIKYSFAGDYTNRILNTQIYKEGGNSKMSWTYTDFGLTDNKYLFPMNMKMELTLPDDVFRLNMGFKTVKINADFELDYGYPSKYKRITLREALKIIENLQ